ncbi:MAG: ABC transporter ATP-binding protein [Ilumatobacter sp.]|jgi:ATP-binding cassette subfamily B multidrug efflux pump|uniref:ABC transporter ATP-binding protein n=1 Tax=Ilumatobacter sp. TaxID=1967498 RepID=UPI001DE406D5|nr:ABC transporter ATP-binding protein [Ilumatobacter sp.]MBT5275104.1 ABC transporter ATP-binding protein [Ilumatobacter sp.]MBT5864027.1 ABC transporter ATP-binding protein [Ilumatobacter sp.]MBT7428708.1 ABC transporter ATP-binding protein [Ilumatobacter sp.]MDG0976082.1 ABC transporter ATP-binding protein [Ilumatobacter sp.]
MSDDTTPDEIDRTADVPGGDDERDILTTTGAEARRSSFGPGGSAGMPAEKTANFGPTVKRLGEILGAERLRLWIIGVLTVLSVTIVVIGPRLLGEATDIIVDGLIPGSSGAADGIDFDRLHSQLMLLVGLYVISFVLAYGQAFMLAGVVQRSMFALRESVETKLNRLPLAYIDKQSRGDLLSRVTNDIDNLAQSLQQTVSQILTSLLTLIGVTVMMFLISPLLAAIALVTVPLSIVLIKVIGGRAGPRFVEQWRHTGAVNGQAEEVFTGHAIVKSFGQHRKVEERFAEDNDKLYEASFAAQFMSGLIQPAMTFMGNIQYVLIAVVGGLRISSGAISIGDMQAMIQYARNFSEPLTRIASMATTFQSGIASLERVLELLDADEQTVEQVATVDPPPVLGRVVFDDVNFSYLPEQPLIQNLNLTVEPGQTIAIVGPTGAGKTTLVNLIMRFYDLQSGAISLDGRDIASFPRAELRSKVGMVLQDTWLFGGTIRENLAYGNPHATEEQIQEAARVTYVDRFVSTLPDGYDTVINDEGDNISIGEKQLITIARAFLANPSILILDEATSSVDTRTEVLIQEAMNALRQDRTSFVIAHRLSTIRGADVILVMEDGHIVEQGAHGELLRRGGAYARLHGAQFAGQAT